MSTIRMTHPDQPGQTYEALESQVPILRASGWRTAEEASANPPSTAAAKQRTVSTATTGKE